MNLKLLIALHIMMLFPAFAFSYQPYIENDQYFLEHLKKKKYAIDTLANAVVLYDKGTYKMDRRGDGTTVFLQSIRHVVRVLSVTGMKEADIAYPYYGYGSSSNVIGVSGKTYKLVNGELKVDQLDVKTVTTEVVNDYCKLVKFSMPAVSDDCIIDYTFEIEQPPTLTFVDWYFQDYLPVLHSEVSATYSDKFSVAMVSNSIIPFQEFNEKDIVALVDTAVPEAYTTTPTYFSGNTTIKWTRRNVPGIVEEPFNYNIDNYVDRLGVYLTGSKYDATLKYNNWEDLNHTTYSDDKMYADNASSTAEVRKIIKDICSGRSCTSGLDTARALYDYVRKNYTVTNKNTSELENTRLKKLIDNKKGSGLELNLLLVKMLSEAGYKSNLVILATRDRGRLLPQYPILDNVNYTASRTEIGSKVYYTDATEKYCPFGVMPVNCYNGFAWAVDDTGFPVTISPDSICERYSVVYTTESSDIDDYRMNIMQVFGDVNSPLFRQKWLQDTSEIRAYFAQQVKMFAFETELLDYKVQNLEDIDEPLKIHYRVRLKWPAEAKLLLAPSFVNYMTENVLKSPDRMFPVEMSSAVDANFVMFLQLPVEFKVEEVPVSANYKMDENDNYKYLVQYQDDVNTLSVKTRYLLQKTLYDPRNYHGLQLYFDKIIEQQRKQCVISRIEEQ